jgi:hypothetical protein
VTATAADLRPRGALHFVHLSLEAGYRKVVQLRAQQ